WTVGRPRLPAMAEPRPSIKVKRAAASAETSVDSSPTLWAWLTSVVITDSRPAMAVLRMSASSGARRAARRASTSSALACGAGLHALGGLGRLRVRQLGHPERVGQSQEAGDERDEERHLQRAVPGVGVDADDFVLGPRRRDAELSLQLGVAHDLGVMLERSGD